MNTTTAPNWTASADKLANAAPGAGEYAAWVIFTRDLDDDSDVIAGVNAGDRYQADGAALARQLATELQAAYDDGGIAGRFQVAEVSGGLLAPTVKPGMWVAALKAGQALPQERGPDLASAFLRVIDAADLDHQDADPNGDGLPWLHGPALESLADCIEAGRRAPSVEVKAALGWIILAAVDAFTENRPRGTPEDDRDELRALLAVIQWAEAAGVPGVEQMRDHLPDDKTCAGILANADPLAALRKAERFLAGFEDDCTQEGLPDTLADVRAAIAGLEA